MAQKRLRYVGHGLTLTDELGADGLILDSSGARAKLLQRGGAGRFDTDAYDGFPGDGMTDERAAFDGLVNTTMPAGAAELRLGYGSHRFGSAFTFPEGKSLVIPPSGIIAPDTGVVVQINSYVHAGLYQIFGGDGEVRLGRAASPVLHPEWWGAAADGVTDCTFAFLLATEAAEQLGESTMVYQIGTYLTNLVPCPSLLTHQGAGKGLTWIKKLYTTSGSLFASADPLAVKERVTIQDLSIDGSRGDFEHLLVDGGGLPADGDAQGVRMDRWKDSALRRVSIKDCATDAVYVGVGANDVTHFCQDIELDDVQTQNVRRNGLSVISVKGIRVRATCAFRGAQGGINPPQAGPFGGIDFEPDAATCWVQDAVIEPGVICEDNDGPGFLVYLNKLKADAALGVVQGNPVSIYAPHIISRNNGTHGARVARIEDTSGPGLITVGGSFVGNGDVSVLVDNKSIHGARVRLLVGESRDAADGTITDPDGTPAHIKLWANGTAGLTTEPGGVEILSPRAQERNIAKPMLYVAGNASWDDVLVHDLRYDITVGTAAERLAFRWAISAIKRFRATGEATQNYRVVNRTANTVLSEAWSFAIITCTGAGVQATHTLTPIAARPAATHTVRHHFRVTEAVGMIAAPAAGETIAGLAVGQAMQSTTVGGELILENSDVAGIWRIVHNHGWSAV